MSFSQRFIRALMSASTGDTVATLLTVEHPELAGPIRVCDVGAAVVSRGQTFQPWPFEFTFPGEGEAGVAVTATLRLDNTSPAVTGQLRSIQTAATLTAEIVLAETPDVVEFSTGPLTLREIQPDGAALVGVLASLDFAQERFPRQSYTPSSVPGLF